MSSPFIESLRRAVSAAPDDVPLRLHLAQELVGAGDVSGGVEHAAAVLQRDPTNADALELIARAARSMMTPAEGEPAETNSPDAVGGKATFDWRAAEAQVDDLADPMFVRDDEEPEVSAVSVEPSALTLSDVGGMERVKERIDAAFLAPLRNPKLRQLYSKSLRGGLLLYGPPGCGKTFIARAVAGELGAKFISVGLADVLDPYIGNSERNVRGVFELARREAPCVLFLDEIDAIGQRRSMTRNNAMRGTVNQLLTELDGVAAANDGVFVLAASNQPWDVDPAMRRPGRLDRTVLVLPPDEPARDAIFRYHLRDRPVEGINLRRLARATDGYSGADIAYVCEVAAEQALLAGARSNDPRLINMNDMEQALRDTRPSTGAWLESARNVVLFADQDGSYAELRDFLKKTRRL
ncbi:AAA family ATPase [Allobranchiibius sp. CTAmp26]|uniref:AAA family ATPase n=1 Tax=Allobranchiibius sp. CTAmp26 TaxID=2815214 RepID=UPI001AA19FFB|nr:AAA family ATPase [Allobranchiibius sp. CTAmp26]MBO1756240.1 AAA family ATPase [Allobranchiibius sp. CTAmp26]